MPFRNESLTVDLKIPGFGGVSGKWVPDDAERQAAWELYIELATRVTTVPLGSDEGLLREALSSFYAMFDITRATLKRGGPDLAIPKHGGDVSLASLAIAVLNGALRPLLAHWHPMLLDREATRASGVSQTEHEQAWTKAAELREVIEATRRVLIAYANELAKAAKIPPITGNTDPSSS